MADVIIDLWDLGIDPKVNYLWDLVTDIAREVIDYSSNVEEQLPKVQDACAKYNFRLQFSDSCSTSVTKIIMDEVDYLVLKLKFS